MHGFSHFKDLPGWQIVVFVRNTRRPTFDFDPDQGGFCFVHVNDILMVLNIPSSVYNSADVEYAGPDHLATFNAKTLDKPIYDFGTGAAKRQKGQLGKESS